MKKSFYLFIFLSFSSVINSYGQFNAYIKHYAPFPLSYPCPNDVKHYTIEHNIDATEVESVTNTAWSVTNGEIVDDGGINDNNCSIRWFDEREGQIHIDRVVVETNNLGTYYEDDVELSVGIRSLKGTISQSISGNRQVELLSTVPITYTTDVIKYGTNENVTIYSWTIPPNWKVNGVISDGSNIYTTAIRHLTVTPDLCTDGQIKVWAENTYCEGFLASNKKSVDISRIWPDVEIEGSPVICNSSSYQINNLPSGYSITWDASSNITRTGAQGSNPCSFSSTNYDYGYIKATISSNTCNSSFDLPDKLVRLNGPSYSDVVIELKNTDGSSASFMCPNTHYHLFCQNNFGSCSLSNYTWSIPSGWTTNYAYNNMISIYTNSSPGGMTEVYADNCCEINRKVVTDYFAGGYCGGYYMVLSPNPADSYVELTFIDEDDNQDKLTSIDESTIIKKNKDGELGNYTIEILNKNGNILKSSYGNELNKRMYINDIKPGKYYLHIITENDIYKRQIIIK